jgi:hypothetical protein
LFEAPTTAIRRVVVKISRTNSSSIPHPFP